MGYTHQVVLFDRDNNDKPWVFWDLEGMPFSANLRWKCFVSSTRNNIYDYGSGINFNQIRLFWSNKLAIIHYIHSSFIDSLSPLNPLFVVDFSASHVWFGNWPFPLGHPKLLADVRRTQSQGHCLQRVPGMDGSSPAYWTMVSEGAVYQPTSYQFPSKNHGFSPQKKSLGRLSGIKGTTWKIQHFIVGKSMKNLLKPPFRSGIFGPNIRSRPCLRRNKGFFCGE